MDPILKKIIEKLRNGQIILWVGSGFSRYTGIPNVEQLIQMILSSVSENDRMKLEKLRDQSLENISEEFVRMHHGSKKELYEVFHKAFNIDPTDLLNHIKLKEIPQLTNIVTTNYDKLFEKAYGSDIYAIVNDADLPQSNLHRVRLFKVHGDIDLPDTMVITRSDYNEYFRLQAKRPIWSVIRSMLATSSILFIGYSIEDSNIQTILKDNIESLAGTHNECYFVAPNTSEYRIEMLGNDKIVCIDMTAEEFVSIVHSEVTKNLLKDTEKGLLDPRITVGVLKTMGITPDFSVTPDCLRLKSISLNDSSKKIEGKFQLTINNHPDKIKQINDVFYGKSFSPIVLEGGSINAFQSSICGVELPTPVLGSDAKLIISPVPFREAVTSLRMKNSIYTLHNVVIKSYLSPQVLQMDFEHPTIKISTRVNIPESRVFSHPINMSIHFEFNDTKSTFEGKLATDFFCAWVDGDELMMLDSDTGRYNSLFPTLRCRLSEKHMKSIDFLHKIYESLVEIEAKFHVAFSLPSDFSNDDIDTVFQINKSINGEAIHLNHFQSQWVINNQSEMLEWIKAGEKPIKIEFPAPKYSLFGIDLNLGIGVIECADAVIENKREVRKALEHGGTEVFLKVKSKSDKLFVKFPEFAQRE